MQWDEAWLRAHLPPDCRDAPFDCFAEEYLDGLTVMARGERGGPDTVVYQATDEDDLRWWQLEQICVFLDRKDPPAPKVWRYTRHHAENGRWFYVEHRPFDYNAIEDARLNGFEAFLRNTKACGFPEERWEKLVQRHIDLMNRWFRVPHWDYDRARQCFVEISDSREHDVRGGPDEPRPGSVIRLDGGPEQEADKAVPKHSERELADASAFREGVHREALERLRETDPAITEVVDAYPVEAYFEDNWEYPGRWYTYVAVPPEAGGRKKLVERIVRDTLAQRTGAKPPDETEEKHAQRPELPESPLPESKPFQLFYADYPDAAADVYIVKDTQPCRGLASHRRALAAACQALSAPDEDGFVWRFDAERAQGRPVSSDAPFLRLPRDGGCNLRKAVLDPPHGSHYDTSDFDALCAALFPKGRARLEVFEWSTDWSDWFDDGHEWWGAMCCTVYDRSTDRYAVLLASATD